MTPDDREPDLVHTDIPFSATGLRPEPAAQDEPSGFEPLSAIGRAWLEKMTAEWAQYAEAHRTAYHEAVHALHRARQERDQAVATAARWRDELRRYTAAQVRRDA